MNKVLWDAMAASAITITMEDFFSTFLKKLSENIKNLLVHYMLGDSFLLINRFYFCILILLVFLQSQNFLLICFLDISHMRSVLIYYYLQIK